MIPCRLDRRPDSIGKAIPNAEILVVRPDGSLCAPGEEGELVHRGALVALGYWNDPERTAVRFRPAPGRDGSHLDDRDSGLVGRPGPRHEEGFLYFVGRNDEMIKTSGYRVSPTEIEEVVYDTGLVRDAVALGVEDPRLGQRIVLVVELRPPSSSTAGSCWPVQAAAAAVHGARDDRHSLRASRSPNGKLDRSASTPGVGGDDTRSPRPSAASIAAPSAGVPLDLLAERAGGTPFFAYDRAL